MNVYIDASCDIQYSSFYIYGLYELYGKKRVKFSSKYFTNFKHDNHFFAFVLKDDTQLKKVIIDFTDSALIDETALQWSDRYGKINYDGKHKSEKIIPIGPSFGIRIYSLPQTLFYAMFNLLKAYKRIPDKRKFLSDYKAQFKRPKLSDYRQQPPLENYVFFMASLWKRELQTNTYRANFIKSCRANAHIRFEGGFAPRTKNDIRGYEALTTPSRIDMADYLKKTKDSFLVFNTPAVKDCLGWKLAEYLCLGKAILSTPLLRVLPKPLKDHVDLLYTDGTLEDITEKLNAIVLDTTLKHQLEQRAKTYFDRYLMPEVVIKRLIAQ